MLKDMIVEMNSLVNSLGNLEEDERVCKNAVENTMLVICVNHRIKETLIKNKEIKAIGLNDKQLTAIIRLYMKITETPMTLKQISYLKKITRKQAEEIIIELNNFKRNMK